ncbi:MAG: cob(I)yrinic acid a,c-diamide adenosyltransferase [Candidatus Omnitrophica bacterium]|nr:cob(I)yrinic acid a,c-diamide adenosyltransferase [Candidatus Omnitrophota bacterium]
MPKKGLIHIYCGRGKGKTTAGLGQALRAWGWDKKIIIFQFLKSKNFPSGEIRAIGKLGSSFKIVRFDQEHPMFGKSKVSETGIKKSIRDSFKMVRKVFSGRKYDLVILDEILNAVGGGFIDEKEVISLIKSRPESLELVLTGRTVPKRILALADYVSRITEVRHPFKSGVKARKGVEY